MIQSFRGRLVPAIYRPMNTMLQTALRTTQRHNYGYQTSQAVKTVWDASGRPDRSGYTHQPLSRALCPDPISVPLHMGARAAALSLAVYIPE